MTLLGARDFPSLEEDQEYDYRTENINFSEAYRFERIMGKKVIKENGVLFLTETVKNFEAQGELEPIKRKERRRNTRSYRMQVKDGAVNGVSKLMPKRSVNIISDYQNDGSDKKSKRSKIDDEDRRLAMTLNYAYFAETHTSDYEKGLIDAAEKTIKKLKDEDIRNDFEHYFEKGIRKKDYSDIFERVDLTLRDLEIEAEELDIKADDLKSKRKNTRAEKKQIKKFREDAEDCRYDANILKNINKCVDVLKTSKEISPPDYLNLKKFLMGMYMTRNARRMSDLFDFYHNAVDRINLDKKKNKEDKIDVSAVQIKAELNPLKYVSKKNPANNPYYSYEGIHKAELHIIDENHTAYIFELPEELNTRLFAYSFSYDLDNKSFFSRKKNGEVVLKNMNIMGRQGVEFYEC